MRIAAKSNYDRKEDVPTLEADLGVRYDALMAVAGADAVTLLAPHETIREHAAICRVGCPLSDNPLQPGIEETRAAFARIELAGG